MNDPTEKPSERLAMLDRRARDQRLELTNRLEMAKDRLRPANLAREAGNRALDLGLDAIGKARELAVAHPGRLLAAAAAAGALLGRKPLTRLARAGWTKFKARKVQTAAEESED